MSNINVFYHINFSTSPAFYCGHILLCQLKLPKNSLGDFDETWYKD
jgi:hypothetical protein